MHNIFITGLWRSGTSLLLRLFDGHPDVFAMPTETGIITILEKDPEFLSILKKCNDEYQLLSVISQNSIIRFQDIISASLKGISFSGNDIYYPFEFDFETFSKNFFLCIKNEHSVNRIVYGYYRAIKKAWKNNATFATNNTNRFVYAIQRAHRIDKYPQEDSVRFIMNNVENLNVIELIRDPIYQIGSALKNEKGLSLDQAIVSWSYSYNYIKNRIATYPKRYKLIKYEDLIANPKFIMKKLAEFTKICFHETILSPTYNEIFWRGNSNYSQKDKLEFSKQNNLSKSQIESIHKSLGAFREELEF